MQSIGIKRLVKAARLRAGFGRRAPNTPSRRFRCTDQVVAPGSLSAGYLAVAPLGRRELTPFLPLGAAPKKGFSCLTHFFKPPHG